SAFVPFATRSRASQSNPPLSIASSSPVTTAAYLTSGRDGDGQQGSGVVPLVFRLAAPQWRQADPDAADNAQSGDGLLALIDDEHLQFSGDFDDPEKLLASCHKMGFEGIVSKRRASANRSGPTRDCLKIKTASWRAANRDRWELFEEPR